MPRFERATEMAGGRKYFSRDEVNPRLGADASMDSGAFLAVLWAHFGRPEPCDGGFEYSVHDNESGLDFTAYSGASGPAYGARFFLDETALRKVVEAFERLLDKTTPVDCEHVYSADDEYGGGQAKMGWRNGKSFGG